LCAALRKPSTAALGLVRPSVSLGDSGCASGVADLRTAVWGQTVGQNNKNRVTTADLSRRFAQLFGTPIATLFPDH
jgi:hypothetical protein